MKDQDEKKKNIQEQTPIIDGDTRPDKQEEAVSLERKIKDKKEKKLTKERSADVNSLEDFKDAK